MMNARTIRPLIAIDRAEILDDRFLLVTLPACGSAFRADLQGRNHVEHKCDDQENTRHPEHASIGVQECCVCIDLLWPGEDLQISSEVTKNVPDPHETSESDEPLFPNRRLPEEGERIHEMLS
jgi:hypothetical protein